MYETILFEKNGGVANVALSNPDSLDRFAELAQKI